MESPLQTMIPALVGYLFHCLGHPTPVRLAGNAESRQDYEPVTLPGHFLGRLLQSSTVLDVDKNVISDDGGEPHHRHEAQRMLKACGAHRN